MLKVALRFALGGLLVGLLMLPCFSPVHAAVSGSCVNCHVMHNSQDGSTIAAAADNNLLVSDCVGCHSHSGNETIVDLGSTRVPIVYNLTGYPDKPLAGGNFYYVAQGGAENDVYGHNVKGISLPDENLDHAPGDTAQCANSCHFSLAEGEVTGCQGCHQYMKHHADTAPIGQPETWGSGWYRGLGGHYLEGQDYRSVYKYVAGIEDRNWEQNPVAGHNIYQGADRESGSTAITTTHSMDSYCAGCHGRFHLDDEVKDHYLGLVDPVWGYYGEIYTGFWQRHPTSIILPETGEYAAYNPKTAYDASVPVAWLNISAPERSEATVMCLSCHRAHGSPYPDMLRWDYSTMISSNAGSAAGTGCFKCHTSKDD